MEITAKKIKALFEAMEDIGAKEVYFGKNSHSDLKKDIDEWFYKRSHHNNFYVWGESGRYGHWSYVTNGSEDRNDNLLKITFLEYI
jgi:hypothetical protein